MNSFKLAIYQRVSNSKKLAMVQLIAMHANQATTLPGSPVLPALPATQVLEALPAPPAFTRDNNPGAVLAPIVDKSEDMCNAAQRINCPFYYL